VFVRGAPHFQPLCARRESLHDQTLFGMTRHSFQRCDRQSATIGSNSGMSIRAAGGLETSLYDAVKSFLEA
jgi:hypothetical protein